MHTKLVTSNSRLHAVHTGSKTWGAGRLMPGKGTSDLQVGQLAIDVEAILGTPDEKREFASQFYYIYRDKGVDVDFGEPGGRVKRLVFYDASVAGHSGGARVSVGGVGFGSSRAQAIKAFGMPDVEGGPVRVANRKKSWICYASGLQFEFNARGRVIIIMVFDPRLHRAC